MRWVAGLPPGTRAWLMGSARSLRELERRLIDRLADKGYSEVVLPVLDSGENEAQLRPTQGRSELLRFLASGGDLLALRADFTPQLARLLAPHLPGLELPLRFAYRGEVYRRPDPESGRESQIFQVGAERLEPVGMEARPEIEILEVVAELLSEMRDVPFRIVAGVAGALDDWLPKVAPPQEASALLQALVRRERRVLRDRAPALLEVVDSGVPADPGVLGAETHALLRRLGEELERLRPRYPGLAWSLDLAEFADHSARIPAGTAKDLRSYYGGIVFRCYAGSRADPVGGGGRYDRLFQALGVPVAAAGFALRTDWLAELELARDAR